MNRREWIKQSTLLAGTAAALPGLIRKGGGARRKVLSIAHLTDVHIRPENDIPSRFSQLLAKLQKDHSFDFILNGGDTIHAADYDHITRDRVLEQWQAWDESVSLLKEEGVEIHSCLGNHDMWWAAPDKDDDMYGKPYVVERLGIPHRYYSFQKENWHFFILDGNHDGIALDEQQLSWLDDGLAAIPDGEFALLMSHYPILGVSGHFYPSDHHSDFEKLTSLFYRKRPKVKACISGHMHLLEQAVYNDVAYFCNGAASGFWWGEGNEQSAGNGYYRETPPGYAMLNFYENGDVACRYHPHDF
jgi:3',5'-cyclic-AMP phosphodiesterase